MPEGGAVVDVDVVSLAGSVADVGGAPVEVLGTVGSDEGSSSEGCWGVSCTVVGGEEPPADVVDVDVDGSARSESSSPAHPVMTTAHTTTVNTIVRGAVVLITGRGG